MTSAELLIEVNAAIADICLNGQEVATAGGKKYTKADLASLRMLRDQLLTEVNAGGTSTGVSILANRRHGIPYRG